MTKLSKYKEKQFLKFKEEMYIAKIEGLQAVIDKLNKIIINQSTELSSLKDFARFKND